MCTQDGTALDGYVNEMLYGGYSPNWLVERRGNILYITLAESTPEPEKGFRTRALQDAGFSKNGMVFKILQGLEPLPKSPPRERVKCLWMAVLHDGDW